MRYLACKNTTEGILDSDGQDGATHQHHRLRITTQGIRQDPRQRRLPVWNAQAGALKRRRRTTTKDERTSQDTNGIRRGTFGTWPANLSQKQTVCLCLCVCVTAHPLAPSRRSWGRAGGSQAGPAGTLHLRPEVHATGTPAPQRSGTAKDGEYKA